MPKFIKPLLVILLALHVALLALVSQRDISRLLPALLAKYGTSAIVLSRDKDKEPVLPKEAAKRQKNKPLADATNTLLERHRRELHALLQKATNRSKNNTKGNNPSSWRLPRTIFMFWDSGIENGPWWLKWVWHSWKVMNPSYNHVFLDNSNMEEWFPEYYAVMNSATLDLLGAQKSDYLRLYLLSKYGGVWADATAFCVQPLDNWLPKAVRRYGVFVPFEEFDDRQIMSWFIAADKNEETLTRMLMSFHDRSTRPRPKKLSVTYLEKHETRSSLAHLIGPNVTDDRLMDALEKEGRFPYFMIHYTFNQVLKDNPELKAKFPLMNNRSKMKIFADLHNRVQKHNRRHPDKKWKIYVKSIFNVTDPMVVEPSSVTTTWAL